MTCGSFVLKGDICWSASQTEVACVPDGAAVCVDGVCQGVFAADQLPERFSALPVVDCSGRLVVPGLVDLHLHAPQYAFRGLGMDLELLDWLNARTFPEEARYADVAYADAAYAQFAGGLRRSATTRAVVFGTLHVDATVRLMELLEDTGLVAYVGKVNMDRNSPNDLCETSEGSLAATLAWLDAVSDRFERTSPILTPRFTPSVTDGLMAELGKLCAERGLPVQSHLSENPSEGTWVAELCPWAGCYGQTYERPGLLGPHTVMAHCVWSGEEEVGLLRRTKTFVAHCPQSNAQLSSGIAPVRHYLDLGMNVGLGTDVAGGASLSMWRAMSDAIAASKLRWRLVDQDLAPLSWQEAFWLATAAGGSFFGNVGVFAQGAEFDALVLDDSGISPARGLLPLERLERFVFLAEEGGRVERKFVRGREIDLGATLACSIEGDAL